MTKINLHEMFEKKMSDFLKRKNAVCLVPSDKAANDPMRMVLTCHEYDYCACDLRDAYTAALSDVEAKVKMLIRALEFYAPVNSYDYDKTQGSDYIWNDQGKQARAALKLFYKDGK